MNDPSIAVAMLGAGSRASRGVSTPARETWFASAWRWFSARVRTMR